MVVFENKCLHLICVCMGIDLVWALKWLNWNVNGYASWYLNFKLNRKKKIHWALLYLQCLYIISLCLSVYLSIYLPIYPSIYLSNLSSTSIYDQMIVSLKQIPQGKITVQMNACCNWLKPIHIVYCEILTCLCSTQCEHDIHCEQPISVIYAL